MPTTAKHTISVSQPSFWDDRLAPFLEKYFYILCVGLVVIASVRIMSTYTALSLTIDEPNHFACGLEFVGKHTYHYEPKHAPLSRAMQALGPYIAGARPLGLPAMREEALTVIAGSGNVDRTIFLMRLGNLPFFLLACLTVWCWSWRAFGKPVAVMALGLLTFLPTMLADGGLATTDMALGATVGAAFLATIYWAERPTWLRALLMALCTTMAILSKFTAIGYLPITLGMALVFYLAVQWPGLNGLWSLAKERIGSLLLAAVAMALMIWAGYWFSVGKVDSHWIPFTKVPAPEFFNGVRSALQFNELRWPGFLLGDLRITGWWYYYPLALVFKTPVPFLILAVFGLLVCVKERAKIEYLLPVAFTLGILLPALRIKVDVGIRYIEPVYLGLSIIAALGCRQLLQRCRTGVQAAVSGGLLLAWMVTSVALFHPDYVRYLNEFAGRKPEHVLVDSNLDWGQDLRLLARRLNELGVEEFSLYALDGLKRSDYQEAWYKLPTVRVADPAVRTPGWTVVGPTLDKSVSHWSRERGIFDPKPWWGEMAPTERVGALLLYYVPPPGNDGQDKADPEKK